MLLYPLAANGALRLMETQSKKFCWALGFSNEKTVTTVSFVHNPLFDGEVSEENLYSLEQIKLLNKLKSQIPAPKFDNDLFVAQQQLIEYGKLIEQKLKDGTGV